MARRRRIRDAVRRVAALVVVDGDVAALVAVALAWAPDAGITAWLAACRAKSLPPAERWGVTACSRPITGATTLTRWRSAACSPPDLTLGPTADTWPLEL